MQCISIFQEDETIWNITFGILASIFIIGNIVYLIFGRMTAQPWNFPKTSEDTERY